MASPRGARQRHSVPRGRGRTHAPTNPPSGRRAAAGHPAARLRLVLVVVAPSAARPDAAPASWPSTCAATAAATNRRAATTAGRWPATPRAWSAHSATRSATLVGHADGGLVCWATSVLHPRVVRAIAVVSSPHPVALRASALTRRDQGRALLPWMLRYQLPFWPERTLTRARRRRARGGWSAAGQARKWLASEDFSETIRHHAAGHPDPVGGALGAGVPALGGAQPAARRGPPLHAVDEATAGGARAAHARRRRPLRAGRPGAPHAAVRPARPVRIHRRRRAFRPRGSARAGQRAADAVPDAGATAPGSGDAGAGGHPLRCCRPSPSAWPTSLAVSTKPVSASSTAAPNTTPSTLPSRSISGPPELPCRTVPLMV